MAAKIIKFLVFVSFINLVHSVCQDLDKDACAAIMTMVPNMCDDPCITVLCSDTCNNCPLKCYHCDEQLNPEDCKTVVQCQRSDEVCLAIQRLTPDFIPLFSSGCETRDVCMKVFGNINIRRSVGDHPLHPRALTLKGGCCDVDKCNSHDPENEPTEPPGYVRTTIPNGVNPTYQASQILCTGDDLNATACAALKAADPNVCSKHCVAEKLCQGMCQTCVKCLKCDSISSLSECKTTSVCNVDQKCVQVQQLDINFNPQFRLGCMDAKVCTTVFGQKTQSQPIGKRQLRINGGCCDHSYCNNQTIS
ncbi:uncharacterized protein LOC143047653 [Mytilus galloprovincialis]|uniref:Uncharacterized protein n=1 Tax=Mytilus galloprovincialis TaxID=29158 RepID=A0A8B6C9L2_MYTGA|nr:Hypothetical predicted protein [Mytilus galloprovincialis]